MISLSSALLEHMAKAARQAYPLECCGLIMGHVVEGGWVVSDIVASENLSPTPERNFEVDMRLRLRLQRELRGTGNAVIGHYHSHPGGRAEPSATDLQSAWEDGMIWLIIAAMADGEEMSATVYSAQTNSFSDHDLHITDGG
jgi:proteasome lid subunit RPN8/RPN11